MLSLYMQLFLSQSINIYTCIPFYLLTVSKKLVVIFNLGMYVDFYNSQIYFCKILNIQKWCNTLVIRLRQNLIHISNCFRYKLKWAPNFPRDRYWQHWYWLKLIELLGYRINLGFFMFSSQNFISLYSVNKTVSIAN